MSSIGQFRQGVLRGSVSAIVTFLVGLFFWSSQLGSNLETLSYDLPVAYGPAGRPSDVVLVLMDEAAHRELTQVWGQAWDRALHAKLLRQLTADHAPVVVFDVLFSNPGPDPVADQSLADAMNAHGHVLLAADFARVAHPGIAGGQALPPFPLFRKAAAGFGLLGLQRDEDSVVRRINPGTELDPSLPWITAVEAKAPITQSTNDTRLFPRWLRYYGSAATIPALSYHLALRQPAGYFANKVVFIGGKPSTVFSGEEADNFRTPYTRRDRQQTSGVELQATMFLNLLHGDWLTRVSETSDVAVLWVAAVLCGFGLSRARLEVGVLLALAGAVGVAAAAVYAHWYFRIWFPWVVVVATQIPCALACSFLSQQRKGQLVQEGQLDSREAVRPGPASRPQPAARSMVGAPHADPATVVESPAAAVATLSVPDHELLRCVGRGSYGQVWLARNAIGLYHAVKIAHRAEFKSPRPYEREFSGIKKFMPVSLNHPGLVHVLHVGRNDELGYFFYVMELGDDVAAGPEINPERYSPRTLAKELQVRERLSPEQCLRLFLPLTDALAYLHEQQLVHRDIKPANIIYVRGVAKLADIGLVTEVQTTDGDGSYVGTVGYIPPEGPGTVAADIFSLGKVLYEASMGQDRREYPFSLENPPPGSRQELAAIANIIRKACASDARMRYRTVRELREDLLRIQTDTGRPLEA